MPIELMYENRDAVPEAFRSDAIFDEIFTVGSDGKVTLSGVTGMKTKKDTDAINEALRKEREDHGKVKNVLKAWGDLKPDEVLPKLGRFDELQALVDAGKIDDKKLEGLVEGRLKQRTGPLQLQIDDLKKENAEVVSENKVLKDSVESRDRNEAVRSAATEIKAHATAFADIEMAASVMLEKDTSGQLVTKDGISGVTPGIPVKDWLREMQRLRPHWWPESEGGGSRGGNGPGGYSGVNPFSNEGWNLTEQGKMVQSKGNEFAQRVAKAAGTFVGGPKPDKK